MDACFDAQGNYYFVGNFTNARGFTFIGKLLAPAATVPLPQVQLAGTYTTYPQLSWRYQGAVQDIATVHLQRSANGRDFTTIASVASLQQFTDADAPAHASRLYYRLLLTSKTDDQQYSNIISLSPSSKPLAISVSPNPARDKIVLTSAVALQNATVQLFNAQGQMVQQWAGVQGRVVDLKLKVSAGQYQLHIVSADGHRSLPLQVLR